MKFQQLSEKFNDLEQTSSRLKMTEILSDLFKAASADEISQIVHISLGQLRPKFDKLEFNLAEKMVFRAIAQAYHLDEVDIKKLYKHIGDIGDTVWEIAHKSQSTPESLLSVVEVFEQLEKIAQDSGEGSQERKVTGLANLLNQLDPLSAKYIARMIVGKLRLGFSDMTILDALSWAERGDKSGRNQLEAAYQLSPDIGEVAHLTKQHSIDKVESQIEIKVGVPIIPALAQRLKTADEMIKKMGKVSVDPKYDGTRVQIHFRRNQKQGTKNQQNSKTGNQASKNTWQVKTFTRNLDESSAMFPELQNIDEQIKADEVILDSEAIGYDPQTGALLPFQMTIQRKRKHGINELAKQVPLKFFVFDILYKDGQSLIHDTLEHRFEVLQNTIIDGAVLEKTEFIVTEDANLVRKHHADLLAQGLEGAMVKRWQGQYNPGRKGWSWVKFKEAEGSAAKLSDTIDAVVMGLYSGRGKRTAFGVGAFLIGIEAGQEKILTISKVGTGLTDAQWKELKQRSKQYQTTEKSNLYQVHKDLNPDIWLEPGLVVEVAADEITESPNHTAGYALRFPRLVKFRDDKNWHQATTLAELRSIQTG